jgi:hypothetical protein
VDILVTSNRGLVQLLHNQVSSDHHWIRIRTVGREDNRDGIGALVWVDVPTRGDPSARRYLRQVRPQYSYLSSSEPTVHFGLGKADAVAAVTIRWPTGLSEVWRDLAVDRLHMLTQGSGTPSPSTAAAGATASPVP